MHRPSAMPEASEGRTAQTRAPKWGQRTSRLALPAIGNDPEAPRKRFLTPARERAGEAGEGRSEERERASTSAQSKLKTCENPQSQARIRSRQSPWTSAEAASKFVLAFASRSCSLDVLEDGQRQWTATPARIVLVLLGTIHEAARRLSDTLVKSKARSRRALRRPSTRPAAGGPSSLGRAALRPRAVTAGRLATKLLTLLACLRQLHPRHPRHHQWVAMSASRAIRRYGIVSSSPCCPVDQSA